MPLPTICPCQAQNSAPTKKQKTAQPHLASPKQRTYALCCGRFIEGNGAHTATTAEELMRSRYTAFVLQKTRYLLDTWHASTRPEQLDLEDSPVWLGLEIKAHKVISPTTSEVEFVARYKSSGRATRMHERSQFIKEAGQWFYVDGVFMK